MQLVDDEGNLFGVVNLIDALVVLVVLAVVLTGATLVSTTGPLEPSGPPTEPVKRYGTVELGKVHPSVAMAIDEGDVVARSGDHTITVTDVYTVPTYDGHLMTTVRTEIMGATDGSSDVGTLQFGGSDVYLGRQLKFATQDYRTGGRVVAVDERGESVPTKRVPVTITLRAVSPAIADALDSGMVGHSTGERYAKIEDIEQRPAAIVVTDSEGTVHERAHPWKQTVRISVSLTVRETNTGLDFQGRRLQVGRDVYLDFGTVAVKGTVTHVEYPNDME